MKSYDLSFKHYYLAACTFVWCALNVNAQTSPTITSQPSSLTNLAGSAASFNVAVAGAGPFTYQWQFNGTNLPSNIIITVAGNGTGGFGGDGGAATSAMLDNPSGVAFDASGGLFIADLANNRIRMVNTNGIITTVAGKNIGGYSGDDGAATNASLDGPNRVVFDALGNFYITDTQNQRIRRVNTNGIIVTVAGNGTNGYSGDGGMATNASLHNPVGMTFNTSGSLYFADDANSRIRKVAANGVITTVAGNGTNSCSGDGGSATNAGLYYPNGIFFDASGNLYIADAENQRIRKMATNGIITTVAGNGTNGYSGDGGAATNAEFANPRDVALDSLGNLYIADYSNNRIRKVATNGITTLVAGNGTGAYSGNGGPATNAELFGPTAMAFDASGNLYIADVLNNRIREVLLYAEYPSLTLANVSPTNAGNYSVVVTGFYGSVTSQVATLTVALPPTVIIQPDSLTNLAGTTATFNVTAGGIGPFTYQWQFNGTNLPNDVITTVLGNGSTGILNGPKCVAFDASGNLFVADTGNARILRMDTSGIITTPVNSDRLLFPQGMALDASGNLYVANTGYPGGGSGSSVIDELGTNGMFTKLAGNGSLGYSGDGGMATNSSLYYPWGIALDTNGNLFIADNYNNRIRKVAANQIIRTVAGNGAGAPFSGFYYGDGGAATNAGLYYPSSLAFDVNGNLLIADSFNQRIRRIATNGIITTVAGNGRATYSGDGGAATNASLFDPNGVAFDALGNFYIADDRNNRIRKVDTNGIITTFAGNGTATYAGDGGGATNASLNAPANVAFDAVGNLYIADANDNRIREVHSAGLPTLTLTNLSAANAGNYSVVITSPYGSVTSSIAVLYMPPYINVQPQNTSVFLDSSATFFVGAAGTGPINYQWLFASTNLVGADNAYCAVSIAQPSDAGSYFVIVTNNYGSATSSIASLTVMLPPIVPTSTQTNGSSNIGFAWSAIPGLTYQVEYKTNLSQADWINLGDPVVTTNTAASVLDSFGTDPQRFYRVELLQ